MYHAYWGLSESPFRSTRDGRFFFQSQTHEEALARLQFLVDDRRRLGLLLSPSGCGKSLLLDVFGRQCRYHGCQVATANLIGVTPAEMLWSLCAELGGNPPIGSSAAALWRTLVDQLAENRYQQLPTILMLDDADEATPDVRAQVVRLAQINPAPDSRMTLILTGQSGRIERLGTRLLELAELRVDVESWDETDTAGYLEFALSTAGRHVPTFTEAAISELQRISAGVPRRLQQLADLALAAGAGYQLDEIDAGTVETVFQELAVAG